MSTRYVCAVTGHSPPFIFDLEEANLTDCARASVQDVLEHAADYHYAECACNLKIGGRAWVSSTPLSESDDSDWDMSSNDLLSADAILNDLRPAPKDSTLYLVLSGDKSPSEDYLRLYREKIFVSHCVKDARVFTRAGGPIALPPRTPASFDALCSTPGSVFVDKSKSVLAALRLFSSSRVNIIRRPKGFGKTTLLSMLDAFFDPLSTHAHLPFTFTEDMSGPVFRARGRLLVFALNLEDAVFKPSMSPDELEAECDRLMNAASQKFYSRYRDLLHVSEQETSRDDFTPTFLHLIRWTKNRGWHLFFTIDNYTAPLLDGPNWSYERSISEEIFARLSNMLFSGFIRYGLIVGDDIPHASERLDLPGPFVDLTDEPELFDVIGFTLDEVVALGQALSTDLIAALPPGTPTGRYARRVYAAGDIVALARSVTGAQSHADPPPTEVRTMKFKHPPPVGAVEPVASEDFEWDGGDDAQINEGIVDIFGSLSDEDDDDEYGADAQAPEMTDDSSKGSSDSSSDGSASAPPSGGKDKVMIVPADEPSSPLEGYDKKPWAQDHL